MGLVKLLRWNPRSGLLLGVVAVLAGCASSRPAAYSGRLYSVAEVRAAFSQLGLRLHGRRDQGGTVSFQLEYFLGDQPAGRAGTLVVATRRSTVGSAVLPGRKLAYANVSVFSTPGTLDEIRGALSALRWGTLAQGKPAEHTIVLGKSIGPIRLGEPRKAVERALGPGTERRRGFVSYFGGRLVAVYEFHGAITDRVERLSTTSPSYRTRFGVHVGSSRRDLRRIFATCGRRDGAAGCYLLEGRWPDALATSFTLRDGRVTEISMGNA